MDDFCFTLAKPGERAKAETLGHVAALMAASPAYRGFPMASLTAWIETPIALDQIRVFIDPHRQRPIGYATWAYLAPDTEQRWIHDPRVLLHVSEWNEGERLWLMDLVAPYGHARAMLAYLRDTQFADQRCLRSLRRSASGATRAVHCWRRDDAGLRLDAGSAV